MTCRDHGRRGPSTLLRTIPSHVEGWRSLVLGFGNTTDGGEASTTDTDGNLLVIEHTNRAKGGLARHLHYEQDEWSHVLNGESVLKVGDHRLQLNRGDSVLAPRRVPRVWAYVESTTGMLLIAFTPAGEMEAFFREVAKLGSMPPQDPALWRDRGMERVGPPLTV